MQPVSNFLNSTLTSGESASEDLKSLIKEVIFSTKTPSSNEKEVGKAKLEAALQHLKGSDSESLLLMGEIFTKYARLSYEDFYPHCMVMMRASLNAQLSSLGIYKQLHFEIADHTLEELKKVFMSHEQFTAFDHFILSSDPNVLAAQIEGKNLEHSQLTLLGFTLSWMANSLHHTEGFREKENEQEVTSRNHKRFDQIYILTEKVLLLADTEEAKQELAELYYNGLRGMELRKDPKNLEAAHAWLEKGMGINPSLSYKARVANIKSCDYSSIGDIEKVKHLLDEAIKIREGIAPEEQDQFLVANLYCRRAGFAIKESALDQAESFIGKSLEHAESCRSARNPETDKLIDHKNDHQYFGFYDFQMAQIKFAKNEPKAALLHINRALDTFEFHKQDSADFIAMALTLKAKVEIVK